MPTPEQPTTDLGTGVDSIQTQRVIKIPIQALREGNSRYNIVVRPGDVINVPSVEVGEFYLMGHVNRAGVYTLTGRKVTLKQAIAAAGNLDGLAIPRRAEIIRRVGANQEVTVQVNLQAIFDGEQPDLFLKPNDILNVGTDIVAPFLAVTRNAYRASYGWGYVYDKNLSGDVTD
jgi:protein involved in polysaccharide export with SLBB domain